MANIKFYPLYELDHDNAEMLRLSNDAFFFLYCGEEPLDDLCEEEIAAVMAKYPDGYQIGEWEYTDTPGIVEALFTPYVMPKIDGNFDLYMYENPKDKDIETRMKYLPGRAYVMIWKHIYSTNSDVLIERRAQIIYGKHGPFTVGRNKYVYDLKKFTEK